MAYIVGFIVFVMVFDMFSKLHRRHKRNIGKRPWSP